MRTALGRSKIALLALICAALLLPIWLVRYPPLLDYPNHLARTFILVHLNDPAYHFPTFYRADWGPYPYLGMDLTVVALQHFLPVMAAGKVFLSLCVLTVPAAAWWLIRQANPGNDWLAVLGLLAAYDVFFLEGFGVFQLALAFCFVTIGCWLRYLREPRTGAWLVALGFATLTYFAHLIAFGIAGFIVIVYTVAERRSIRAAARAALLFIPGVVLYLVSGIVPQKGSEIYYRDWDEKYSNAVDVLRHSYSVRMEMLVFWAVVACLALALVRNREVRLHRPWLYVCGALLAFYIALPDEVGESWDIDIRVIPALFVIMLLVASVGRRQRMVAVVGLCIFAVRIADLSANFVAQQRVAVAPMEAAIQALPRDVRLLPLIDEHPDDDPLFRIANHFWAYSVIERGARPVYLFDLKGQTPLRINPGIYAPPRPIEEPLDWAAIARDYDYVWIEELFELDPQLRSIGTKVFTAGNLRLYRISHRGPAGSFGEP